MSEAGDSRHDSEHGDYFAFDPERTKWLQAQSLQGSSYFGDPGEGAGLVFLFARRTRNTYRSYYSLAYFDGDAAADENDVR